VAKGYTQTHGIDYEEIFSPVAKISSIRIMLAIAAFHDYEIWQMDVKTAFLNGKLIEDVFMAQPEGFENANMVSRHQQNPGEGHWPAVKNILKYLRNTKDRLLVYGGEEELRNRGAGDMEKFKQDTMETPHRVRVYCS
ncbi:retrotransposon protein, putative, ty1-copia subclass, partial [Tanacetum coccineum]